MSSLTKSEKQALNELFIALKEKENILQKIKNTKNIAIYTYNYFLKSKKIKHPLN